MAEPFRNVEAARLSRERVDFSFGENWTRLLKRRTQAQLDAAKAALVESLGGIDLAGRSFLDIGCGSGLFSLAAFELGAASVVSVDIDPESVRCATYLRDLSGAGDSWRVTRRSILDNGPPAIAPPADIVYSWGVLHHTGNVAAAVEHALDLVAPGGCACIALYNTPPAPRFQMSLKRLYNRAPRLARPPIVALYALGWLSAYTILKRRNPVALVRSYEDSYRGMSYWRDAVDWLGGLPCQFVEPAEFAAIVAGRPFVIDRITLAPKGGNNEYILRRTD